VDGEERGTMHQGRHLPLEYVDALLEMGGGGDGYGGKGLPGN